MNTVSSLYEIFSKLPSRSDNEEYISSLKDIKRVVVLASASRSGSSLLYSQLRGHPDIISFDGESTPFLRLAKIIQEFDLSERIECSCDDIQSKKIQELFCYEIKEFSKSLGVKDEACYLDNLFWRISFQWPHLNFSYEKTIQLMLNVRHTYALGTLQFVIHFFRLLQKDYSLFNPYYYDLDSDLVYKNFPDVKVPEGPPCSKFLIEDPLFVLPSFGSRVKKNKVQDKVLLLKNPSDAYRLDYLRSIFPQATFQYIYLTRNPLASINGLYDGWLHRGFFSRNMKKIVELDIQGYSHLPWGKEWWNFELPPGWQNYVDRKLEEVCAYQWTMTNEVLCENILNSPETLQIKNENFHISNSIRLQTFKSIFDFLSLSTDYLRELENKPVPLVQITSKPRQNRWLEREIILLKLLKFDNLKRVCRDLGYDLNHYRDW